MKTLSPEAKKQSESISAVYEAVVYNPNATVLQKAIAYREYILAMNTHAETTSLLEL